MALYNNVYIGHVETINLDSYENDTPIESKVVALRYSGINKQNQMPIYKPLRKYGEYYKVKKVEPLNGIVSDKLINQAIIKTGKQEVRQLTNIL